MKSEKLYDESRWQPRYSTRAQRPVLPFLLLDSCSRTILMRAMDTQISGLKREHIGSSLDGDDYPNKRLTASSLSRQSVIPTQSWEPQPDIDGNAGEYIRLDDTVSPSWWADEKSHLDDSSCPPVAPWNAVEGDLRSLDSDRGSCALNASTPGRAEGHDSKLLSSSGTEICFGSVGRLSLPYYSIN